MFIRYFADTTDGAHGQFARSYIRTLIKIAPTRIVTTTPGVFPPKWFPWSPLFNSPAAPDDAFINVVCCHPTRWAWNQNIGTQFRDGKPSETMVVHDDACAMLWEMAGVRRPHVIGPDGLEAMRGVLFP